MKSKISFFNLGLVQQIFRQHGWIGSLYLVVLMFALPLQLLIISSKKNEYLLTEISNLLSFSINVQAMFLFTLPVLAGVFLFRYLQVELSVDMIHSLPIKRETLYVHHLLSGLVMLIVPIWLTAFVTHLVIQTNGLVPHFSLADLYNWGLIMTLFTAFFFSFTVVVGMATGMSIVQGIFTYVLLLLPFGLYELLNIHLRKFLFGFSINYFSTSTVEDLTPFTRFPTIGTEFLSFWETIIYLVLIFVLLFIGFLFYKRRSLEMATEALAFPFLRPLFQYGLTFSAMLLAGAYFDNEPTEQVGWLIFGYSSGAIIGYFISEMVMKKSWRVFHPKAFIGLTSYTAVILVLFTIIQLDVFGYETKLPKVAHIEGVYFGKGYEMLNNRVENQGKYSEDKLYIQDVHDLHENIVKEKVLLESISKMDTEPLSFSYIMNNGTKVVREYQVPTKVLEASLKPVMESEHYKKKHLQIVKEKTESITIHPTGLQSGTISIFDPAEINELRTILQKELYSQSYEEMVDTRSPWAQLEFFYSSPDQHLNSMSYDWKKTYEELEAWLDRKGYLEKARLFPEQLQYVEVAKAENLSDDRYPDPEQRFKSRPNQVKIEDKEQITIALTQFSEYSTYASYYVKMKTKAGNDIYGVYTDETVPAEIASMLK
ncbi:DUF6449 domain-containing protein [Metabacillus herbersteinensis]|uniref:DUF6449 domain-containing protein n=1 Tax=Metabacillus herbersteinensis TaxID=283816 RepID=A0ABV6GGV8_9BACI